MARTGVNGAVISDNGQWYMSIMSSWKPLVAGATDKPGFTAKETGEATKLMRKHCKKDATKLGEQLAALIAEHGSLAAVEASAVQTVAPAPASMPAAAGALPRQQVISYESAAEFEREAPAMIEAGWRVVAQSAESGHINARRSALRIATGGVLLGGLSRTKGSLTVTWERD